MALRVLRYFCWFLVAIMTSATGWTETAIDASELKPVFVIDDYELKALSGEQKQKYINTAKPIIVRIKPGTNQPPQVQLLVLLAKAQSESKEWPAFADALQSKCETTGAVNKATCTQLVHLRDRTLRQNGTH